MDYGPSDVAYKRTLFGPNVSTPADRSGPEAAERPPGSVSPTADAAANCKIFRLERPTETDFSRILFLLTPIDLHRVLVRPNWITVQTFPAARLASRKKSRPACALKLAGQSRNLFPEYGTIPVGANCRDAQVISARGTVSPNARARGRQVTVDPRECRTRRSRVPGFWPGRGPIHPSWTSDFTRQQNQGLSGRLFRS